MHFLPASEPDLLQFIFANDETLYRHLYIYTVQLAVSSGAGVANGKTPTFGDGVGRSVQVDKQQLTSGEWEVLDQWLWVDQRLGLVYFIGLKDGPLNTHLYATSFRQPGSSICRLTKEGFSHSVFMNEVITSVN